VVLAIGLMPCDRIKLWVALTRIIRPVIQLNHSGSPLPSFTAPMSDAAQSWSRTP